MKERILARIQERIQWYDTALELEKQGLWQIRYQSKRDVLYSLKLDIEDMKE